MNDIWTLMKKYRFDIDKDINKNVLCTICNGLLINAHSSPCGCMYCFDCIRDHLNGMEKVCPGQLDDCKEEMININKNVFPDNVTNRNVLRTIVKCPERNCVFEDELRNIGDHIRLCDNQSVECPFMNIGCKDVNIVNVYLKKHLLEEIVGHSYLMLESMDNLRNEMEIMKKNVTTLTMKNKDLKKEIIDLKEETVSKVKSFDSRIENQDEQIKEFKKKFSERVMICDQHCDTVRERINVMKKVYIDVKSKIDANNESILLVKDKIKEIETKSMKESESMKSEIFLNKNIVESVKKMCEEEKEKMKVLQCNVEMMENNRERDKKLLSDKIDEMSNINNDLKLHLDINEKSMVKIDDNNQRNIDQLRKEMATMKKDELTNKKSIEELERKCERQNGELKELKEKIEMRRNEMEKEKDRADKIDKSISNIDEKLNVIDKNLTLQISGEFVWRIDKWKEKSERARSGIDKDIYSDPFFSHRNGYKMCLCVYPNGDGGGEGTDLSVFLHLMRGEFDDILSWPFKHDVTFELIDQRTKQLHTCKTVKYKNDEIVADLFKKPTEERNIGLGFHFVTLSDLCNKIGLCENDQIFIRCRVTII